MGKQYKNYIIQLELRKLDFKRSLYENRIWTLLMECVETTTHVETRELQFGVNRGGGRNGNCRLEDKFECK